LARATRVDVGAGKTAEPAKTTAAAAMLKNEAMLQTSHRDINLSKYVPKHV